MYLTQKITAKYLEKPVFVPFCIVTEVQALHYSIHISTVELETKQ